MMGCNSTYRLRYWNVATIWNSKRIEFYVVTAPTVYGIETLHQLRFVLGDYQYVATALTVYGMETSQMDRKKDIRPQIVATAFTVYDIETPQE